MVKFNLQLFAKSIETIAKEVIKGNWGNGDTRKNKLAAAGYDYSTVQAKVNELLGVGSSKTGTTSTTKTPTNTSTSKTSNNSSKTSNNSSKTTTTTNAPKATTLPDAPTITTVTPYTIEAPVAGEIKGVDNSLIETINSTFTPSNKVSGMEQDVIDSANAYNSFASNTNIISDDVWAGLMTPYSKSEAVLQAEQLLQSKIDQGYAGTYKEALSSIINDFMNREDFEYDVDKDQMFQQALASAMNSGKSAMQDTMGQAAALTGGYGSTYATSAGNQAYNAFIEDAYNNLPEYYNMALAAYEAEGQQMLQQYQMLDSADTKEYSQWYDDINLTYRTVRDMVGDEYNKWNADQTMYSNVANAQVSENAQISSNLYNAYNVTSNMYESAYKKEWDTWLQDIDSAYKVAGLQSDSYWNTEEMNFNKSEANRDQTNWQNNYNYNVYRDEVADTQWNDTYNYNTYRDSVADTQWQTTYDYNVGRDKVADEQWEKTYALEQQSVANSDKSDYYKGVIEDLEDKYGGYISPDDIEVDEDGNIVSVDGFNIAGNSGNVNGSVADASISGFRTTKNDNFKIAVNGETFAVENKGKVTDDKTKKALDGIKSKSGEAVVYDGDVYVNNGGTYYKVGATNGFLGIGETEGYRKLVTSLLKGK